MQGKRNLPFIYGGSKEMTSKTKVVILGVAHSTQLLSRLHHPGVFRAFYDHISPQAICIERSPEKYLASDYYEFAYEQQYLTIPYCTDKRIPLYPIDWYPSLEDDRLVGGTSFDHEEPPVIRRKNDFIGRHGCFPYEQVFNFDFFFADRCEDEMLKKDQEMLDKRVPGINDYWRRLVLYRTFMEAMRIKEVAKKHKGQTILVVIGGFHKPDLEGILSDVKEIEIVQPSSYGQPSQAQPLTLTEMFAIATYNLLGVQSKYGAVDWEWINIILNQLEELATSEEVILLRTRSNVLQNKVKNEEAIEQYKRICQSISRKKRLTFHGVKHKNRIDSYFDPFGYLPIKNRAELEMAREYYKLKNYAKSNEIKKILIKNNELTWLQKVQIEGYWDQYVLNMN